MAAKRTLQDDEYIINPKSGKPVLKRTRLGKQLARNDFEPPAVPFPVACECVHRVAPACPFCANSATLAQCSTCQVVAPRATLLRHVRTHEGASSRQAVNLELHNALVLKGMPADVRLYAVDISDLVSLAGTYPHKEIAERVKVQRSAQEERCAVDPSDYRSGTNLPDDMWLSIMQFMDMPTLFTMTKVCKRTRMLANMQVTQKERMVFNLQKAIDTVKECMTASRAKSELLLTETDLDQLPSKRVANPHYGSAAPMRLYTVDALLDLCADKYKTWEGFCQHKVDRAERARKLEAARVRKRAERKAELEAALNAHGVPLRNDSRMCESYVASGHGIHGESMQAIVEIMREMHFLYKHTRYSAIIEEIKQEYRSWGEWYRIDEVVEESKVRAACEWRVRNTDVPVESLPPMVACRLR